MRSKPTLKSSLYNNHHGCGHQIENKNIISRRIFKYVKLFSTLAIWIENKKTKLAKVIQYLNARNGSFKFKIKPHLLVFFVSKVKKLVTSRTLFSYFYEDKQSRINTKDFKVCHHLNESLKVAHVLSHNRPFSTF